VAFVNGFCLSRYRKEGPQSSLYVPANLLENGENTVEVFETEGFKEPVVTFKNYIDLG
jgi:beta-galactosidase